MKHATIRMWTAALMLALLLQMPLSLAENPASTRKCEANPEFSAEKTIEAQAVDKFSVQGDKLAIPSGTVTAVFFSSPIERFAEEDVKEEDVQRVFALLGDESTRLVKKEGTMYDGDGIRMEYQTANDEAYTIHLYSTTEIGEIRLIVNWKPKGEATEEERDAVDHIVASQELHELAHRMTKHKAVPLEALLGAAEVRAELVTIPSEFWPPEEERVFRDKEAIAQIAENIVKGASPENPVPGWPEIDVTFIMEDGTSHILHIYNNTDVYFGGAWYHLKSAVLRDLVDSSWQALDEYYAKEDTAGTAEKRIPVNPTADTTVD